MLAILHTPGQYIVEVRFLFYLWSACDSSSAAVFRGAAWADGSGGRSGGNMLVVCEM